MKNIKLKIKVAVVTFLAVLMVAITSVTSFGPKSYMIEASNATSYTYAIDARGNNLVRTQDCYLPNRTINSLGLTKLQDIFIDDEDKIIISGQYNNISGLEGKVTPAVVIYNQVSGVIENYIYEEGYTPNGIYYEKNNRRLYIAYSNKNCIKVYNKLSDGTYVVDTTLGKNGEYLKPDSILFNTATNQEGDTENTNRFDPIKVSADNAGNMYIVCKSVNEGIVQLSITGEFLGYFAVNKVVQSFKQKVQDFFDIESDEMDILPVFTNVFTDKDGMVYTTTSLNDSVLDYYDYVKKHNTAGSNLIPELIYAFGDYSPVDIWVDNRGIIYAAFNTGSIYIYTGEGELLCIFGGTSTGNVAGLFSPYSGGTAGLGGIAVDSKGVIWCIDINGSLVSFNQTDYVQLIYSALDYYYEGLYDKSIELWEKIIELNQMSALAHNNIGLNYLYSADVDTPERYELAMEHLKIARNREAYSQAYWELRNIWLQNNLVGIVLAIVAIVVIVFILKKIDEKKNIFNEIRKIKDKVNKNKVVQDVKFEFTCIENTTDNFYYLKARKKGSNITCLAIWIITFLIFIWYTLGKGFIFQYVETTDIDIVALIAGYFGGIGLLILCNWLVSSIQDGEGDFMAIFRMTCVSLVPWMLSMIIVVLFSHISTQNEVFMLNLIQYAGIILTLFMFFRGISETHYYSFKETVISILLTILLLAVAVLVVLLIINLGGNLYEFIEGIIEEVVRNVTG